MTEEIICISLWRPWAEWVIFGWKTLETRRHARFKNLPGKRIGIHASRKWDNDAIGIASKYLTDDQIAASNWLRHSPHGGKILGTVFVDEHRPCKVEDAQAALIECETPRFGLVLSDPAKFDAPIATVGRQGMWRVALP